MSRNRNTSRRKPAAEQPSEDAQREGYKLNGIVMLVLVFSVLNVLWIAAVAGASPTTALIVAVLIGGVITFNVKRYLEQRYRAKFPEFSGKR